MRYMNFSRSFQTNINIVVAHMLIIHIWRKLRLIYNSTWITCLALLRWTCWSEIFVCDRSLHFLLHFSFTKWVSRNTHIPLLRRKRWTACCDL